LTIWNVLAYVGYPNQNLASRSIGQTVAIAGVPGVQSFTFTCNANNLYKIDPGGTLSSNPTPGCKAIYTVQSDNAVYFAVNSLVLKYNMNNPLTNSPLVQFNGNTATITSLKSDGTFFYASTLNSKIIKWNGDGTVAATFNSPMNIYNFAMSSSQWVLFATGTNSNQLLRFSMSGNLENTFFLPLTTTPKGVALIQGAVLVALDQSVVKLAISNGADLGTWQIGVNIVCMSVYKDLFLIVADQNKNVYVFDALVVSQTPLRKYQHIPNAAQTQFNRMDACYITEAFVFANLPLDTTNAAVVRVNFFDIILDQVVRTPITGGSIFYVFLGNDTLSRFQISTLNYANFPSISISTQGGPVALNSIFKNATTIGGQTSTVLTYTNSIDVDWTAMVISPYAGSTSSISYNIAPLYVTSDSSNFPSTAGNVPVTFYFNSTYSNSTDTVTIKFENNMDCPRASSTTSSFTCRIPSASHGGSQSITITLNNAQSSTYLFSYAPSMVRAITNSRNQTNSFLVDEIEDFYIYGRNFGVCPTASNFCKVTIEIRDANNNALRCTSSVKTDTLIICKTDQGTLTGDNILMNIKDFANNEFQGNITFNYGPHRIKAFSPSRLIGTPSTGVLHLKNTRLNNVDATITLYSSSGEYSVTSPITFLPNGPTITASFSLPNTIDMGNYRLNVTVAGKTATSGNVVLRRFLPSGIPSDHETNALGIYDMDCAVHRILYTNEGIFGVGEATSFKIDENLSVVTALTQSNCLTLARYNNPASYNSIFMGCLMEFTQFVVFHMTPTQSDPFERVSIIDLPFANPYYRTDVTALFCDQTHLYVGTADGVITKSLLNIQSIEPPSLYFDIGSGINALYVVGNTLFVGTNEGGLYAYNTVTQANSTPPIDSINFAAPVNSIVADTQQQNLYVAFENQIKVFSATLVNGYFNLISTFYHSYPVRQIEAGSNGMIYVAGGNVIKIYNSLNVLVNEIDMYDVTSISLNGDVLYASSSLGIIKKFDSFQISITSIERATNFAVPITIHLAPILVLQGVITAGCAPDITGCRNVVRANVSAINCDLNSPEAALVYIDIDWTSCGKSSHSEYDLKYRPPNITAISPIRGVTAGGTTITLNVTNLGSLSSDNITVLFNGKHCTNLNQISLESITCRTPASDRPSVVAVTVKVNQQISVNSVSFTYDPPIVTGTNRRNFSVTGGGTLEIRGSNFGYCTQGMTCAPVIVELGSPDRLCGNPTVINDGKIDCIVPSGIGSGINVKVTIGEFSSTNDAPYFGYRPPFLESITPTQSSLPPAKNDKILINGLDLGFVRTDGLPVYLIGHDEEVGEPHYEYQCKEVVMSNTLTSLTCTVPDDFETVGGHFYVIVSVGGQNSSATAISYHNRAPQTPKANEGHVETNVTVAVLVRLTGSDTLQLDLTFIIDTMPSHGKLYQVIDGAIGPEISGTSPTVIDSQGRIYYKPTDYYHGSDSFRFKSKNSRLTSKTAAQVSVFIGFVNQNPYFETAQITQTISEKVAYSINPKIMDVDEDKYYTVISSSLPKRGIWKYNGTEFSALGKNGTVIIRVPAVASTNYQFTPTDFPLTIESDDLGGFYPPVTWVADVYDTYGANASSPLIITATITCAPGRYNNIWSKGKRRITVST
jgi:hypothetical protein